MPRKKLDGRTKEAKLRKEAAYWRKWQKNWQKQRMQRKRAAKFPMSDRLHFFTVEKLVRSNGQLPEWVKLRHCEAHAILYAAEAAAKPC